MLEVKLLPSFLPAHFLPHKLRINAGVNDSFIVETRYLGHVFETQSETLSLSMITSTNDPAAMNHR